MELTPQQAAESLEVIRTSSSVSFAPKRVPMRYYVGISVLMSGYWATLDTNIEALKVVAMVVYLAGIGALIGWQTRKQGRQPRTRSYPPPLRRALVESILVLFIALGVAFAIVELAGWKHGWLWMAAVVPFVLIGGGRWCERHYAKAYDRWKVTQS
jgi:cytochrome bd-type quinol oxidase subunit 1